MSIRILIVDDHSLFRRGLAALIASDGRFCTVGEAADAGDAQRKAQALSPDVILLDNHLPGVSGVQAIPALLQASPTSRILMLTVSDHGQDLADALRAGASGYLLKTVEAEVLAQAILRVMTGHPVIDEAMTGKLVAAFRQGPGEAGARPVMLPEPRDEPASLLDQLSPRERQILAAIGQGASNKEIARQLDIAESTVKIHVQHLLRKLDATSRVQLAVLATSGAPRG